MTDGATLMVAMGDPQAPFETVLGVLRSHGLLGPKDRLLPGVHLVSMGDHFDWGHPAARADNRRSSLETLTWLSSHRVDQVTLLLGNHDLARVGVLAEFDDATFAAAQAEGDAVFSSGELDEAAEVALVRRYPSLPHAECVVRDYACFSAAQRELVTRLIRERRFRLSASVNDLLLVHSGVTVADLRLLGIPADASASQISTALNSFLDERVEQWEGGPINLEPLHVSGSAMRGEGLGALYHRPVDPTTLEHALGPPPRRRFDPRELPLSLTQVVGHIRDEKCRELMPAWCERGEARDGLRSLRVVGEVVEYRAGVQSVPQMIFVDAGMNHLPPTDYPLFDLTTRQALERPLR